MLLKHDIAKYLRQGLSNIVKTLSPPTPYIPKERILPWEHEQAVLPKPYALFFIGPWRVDSSRSAIPQVVKEWLEPGQEVHSGTAQPARSNWHLYDPNTDFDALNLYTPLFVEVNGHIANALHLVNKHTIYLSKPIGPTQTPRNYVLRDPILKRSWTKPGIMRLQVTVVASNEMEADTIADAFHNYLIRPTGFNQLLLWNQVGARVLDEGEVVVADFVEPREGRDQTWARRRDIILRLATAELITDVVPLIRTVRLTIKAGSTPGKLPCEPWEERFVVHA